MAHPPAAVGSQRTESPARATRDPLLTIGEVLWEIGDSKDPNKPLARSTFDRWRELGSAPKCIKLPNGSLRIRRSALDKFLRSREEQ